MAIKKISANLLGGNAVLAANIAGGAISAADIADNSITAAKISASTSPTFGGLTVDTSTLVVDSTNNRVGVGTASPVRSLHIRSSGEGSSLFLERTSNYGFVLYNEIETTTETFHLGFVNNGTFSSDILVANESGNVGIGTSNPGVELDIKRHTNAYPLRVSSEGGQGRVMVFADVASSPTKYNFIAGAQYNVNNGYEITPSTAVGGYTFSNPAIIVLSSGNVGIADSDPPSRLTVLGSNSSFVASNGAGINGIQVTRTTTSGENIYIYTGDGNATGWSGIGNVGRIESYGNNVFEIGTQQNATISFGTNNAERVRIDGSGNVAIGAGSITDKFNVYGTSSLVGNTYIGSGSNFYFAGGNQPTTGAIWLNGSNELAKIRNLSSSSFNDSGSLVFTIERTSQGGFTDSMWLNYYGALHIDDVNTDNYSGKSWLNESWDSTVRGGSTASNNTYMKNRLWVNGDITLGTGRGVHFGDVTDSAPLGIREGKFPSTAGVDTDELSIWTRRGLSISSNYTRATGSKAGIGATHFQVNMPTGGGTWTESLYTPNGSGAISHRMIEDWSGRWIIVGRFASRSALQSSWSSVTGLSVGSSATTAFSSDWGDIYPKEVRVFGCTDIDDWFVTRTIDFIYGVPSTRQWKHFFAGGTSDGMASGKGVGRFGWDTAYAYDGFGRWRNPNFGDVGMSDANVTNPISAYTTPTTNAFNWYNAQDAKFLVHSSASTASQDGNYTAGFGYDDSGSIHADGIFTQYSNGSSGVTSGWDTDCQFFIALKVYGD